MYALYWDEGEHVIHFPFPIQMLPYKMVECEKVIAPLPKMIKFGTIQGFCSFWDSREKQPFLFHYSNSWGLCIYKILKKTIPSHSNNKLQSVYQSLKESTQKATKKTHWVILFHRCRLKHILPIVSRCMYSSLLESLDLILIDSHKTEKYIGAGCKSVQILEI